MRRTVTIAARFLLVLVLMGQTFLVSPINEVTEPQCLAAHPHHAASVINHARAQHKPTLKPHGHLRPSTERHEANHKSRDHSHRHLCCHMESPVVAVWVDYSPPLQTFLIDNPQVILFYESYSPKPVLSVEVPPG